MTPTFLDNFLTYVEDTEPPRIYYKWSCFALISALLSKKVYYPSGRSGIPPTIYTLFIGNQGQGKDQAAIFGKDILNQLCPEIVGADTTSTSKLMANLKSKLKEYSYQGHTHEFSPLAVYATELESMSAIEDDFFKTLLGLFSQSSFTYDTHTHGVVTIIEPAVTFVGCTNPTSFGKFVQTGRLSQGFARRCPLIYAPERYQDLFDYPDQTTLDGQLAFKRLVNQASVFQAAVGRYSPTPEWRALGVENHERCRQRVRAGEFPEENIAAHYDNRKEYIFRLSMISCVNRQVGHVRDSVEAEEVELDLQLLPIDFHNADQWLQEVEVNLPTIYSFTATNPLLSIENRLLTYLSKPQSHINVLQFLNQHLDPRNATLLYEGLKKRSIIDTRPSNTTLGDIEVFKNVP